LREEWLHLHNYIHEKWPRSAEAPEEGVYCLTGRTGVDENLKARITTVALFCGCLGVLCVSGPNRLMAQAPPGPLSVPPSQGPSAAPRAPRPKRVEPAPRTTIAGAWKLNSDESDDPRRKIKDATGKNNGNYGGYPGSRGGMGGPFPFPGSGGGYPRGPQGNGGGQNTPADPKLLDVVLPAQALTIDLKTSEVEVTDDHFHKLIFITDGRQPQKSSDDTRQEIAAHWDGNRLVSDEKSPEKGKLSRTFELSADGRQFFETFHVDTNKSKTPVVIQYVYDIGTPEGALSHETDPNQPVMKRRSDTNSSASEDQGSQAAQPSDPNQPVMKRRSDDSDTSTQSSTQTSTQSPQAQPPQQPDPDQPVMKRRTDNGSAPSQ